MSKKIDVAFFVTIVFNLVVMLYLLGFVFLPVEPNITNKMILVAGVLSFILVLLNPKAFSSKSGRIIFGALFIVGATNLIWYGLYKTPYVQYKNAYRGYLEGGKVLLFSSFSFLLLKIYDIKFNRLFFLTTAGIGQLILIARAYYQGLYLGVNRIPLSAMNGIADQMGAASIAAYIIVFNGLFIAILLLQIESKKNRWLLFYTNFVLTFAAIILTGSRAAIFTYPLMSLILIFIQCRHHKKIMIKSILALLSLLLISGSFFHSEIQNRLKSLTEDIKSYTNAANSMTSIGARFAMTQAGFKSGPAGAGWQSLEERADKINDMVKRDNIYQGALPFLNVHMHNEIIEAYSTKGIIGLIEIILLYAGLIIYCIKTKKLLLLVFPLSIILLGFSDVMILAKPIPSAWIVGLFLSICSLHRFDKDSKIGEGKSLA